MTIAETMYTVLRQHHRSRVWWGDSDLLDACARSAGFYNQPESAHPLVLHARILAALDRSPYFTKGYIYHQGHRTRCFTLRPHIPAPFPWEALMVLHSYISHDHPFHFLGAPTNHLHQRLLCLLVEDTHDAETWLAIRITPGRIRALDTKRRSLRDTFAHPADGVWLTWTLAKHESVGPLYIRRTLSDDELPSPDSIATPPFPPGPSTMTDQEYQSLLAEQQAIQHMLERIPAENVLDRDSLLVRLEAIQTILTQP